MKIERNKLLIFIMLFSVFTNYVTIEGAEKAENFETSASSFDKEWENTYYFETYSWYTLNYSKTAKMVYGYDTDYIDEDYCWTYGYDQRTQASLTNGKGTYSGKVKNVGKWSKIEITHKEAVDGVEYRIWLEEGYYSKYISKGTSVKD